MTESRFLKQMEDLTGAHFDFIAENPKLPFFLLNEIHLNEKRRELYLPVLSSAVRNTLQNVKRRLEQAVKRGEVRPIRTADLMFSIFSLNVMSFVGQSLVPTGIRFRPGRRAAVHLAATGREH